jgi:hypothetical protein
VIDIEWDAAANTWGESYLCDPQRMRQLLTI